jgi:hypothetical protein
VVVLSLSRGVPVIIGSIVLVGCASSPPLSGPIASTTSTGRAAPGPSTSTPATTRPSTTTPMTGPGAALVRTTLADAEAEQWVHGVSRTGAEGTERVATTSISDAGPGRGTQEITIGPIAGNIRVIGTTTYIHGGPQALVDLFDVPTGIATRLGATWLILRPGDSEYSSVTEGVTISSFLQETSFSGLVTEASTKLGRIPAIVISGALPASIGLGSGELYATRGPRPLPLEWKITEGGGTTTTTFSDWGHSISVAAPAGAVPIPLSSGGIITVGMVRQG